MPANPFVGEIMLFGGNFAVFGWAFCNGQTISIAQNPTLFQLIGTTYGGDGVSTYNLPNFQSRIPLHQGSGYPLGQTGGTESVTLTSATMPSHVHPLYATSAAANSLTISSTSLPGNVTSPLGVDFYVVTGGDTTAGALAPTSMSSAGGSQPHENRMPTLCLSFEISLVGIFPSQN
jgi:microcystin-dependent protein